jgi:hypothetical protein
MRGLHAFDDSCRSHDHVASRVSLHIGGGLIHLLLVVALVVLGINLLSGRRTAV